MKLKSLFILSLAFAALPAFAGVAAKHPLPPAPIEDPLSMSLAVGFDTDYLFHGEKFAKNFVTAQIDAAYKINPDLTFTAGAWYGSASEDKMFAGGGFPFNELDLSAGLALRVTPNLTVGVKYIHYAYLGDLNSFGILKNHNDAGITLATNDLPADFTFAGYRDFNNSGYYFEGVVSKTFAITDRVSIVPAALISYVNHYYGASGWNNAEFRISLPIKISKTATLTPYIADSIPMDALKDRGHVVTGAAEKNTFYGGAALSVTF